jgi:hypothetical protein
MDALASHRRGGTRAFLFLMASGQLCVSQPKQRAREAGTGDAMSSIQGFRCGHCRAELLARPVTANLSGRSGWTPPVLCCGQPLRLLDTGHVLSTPRLPRRIARCPRCGYEVRLVVQPLRPLACLICQTDLVTLGGNPDRPEPSVALVAPANT